jgi:uncharacterized protein YjbI with pentapeptide repeats
MADETEKSKGPNEEEKANQPTTPEPQAPVDPPVTQSQLGDGVSGGSTPGFVPEVKAGPETEKLKLEIEALHFKRSFWGRVFEILQGLGPVIAILALAYTVIAGIQQQQQQRLEQAYTRLGSQLSSERASGVAQLSALLGKDGGERDREVLTALVYELGLDASPEVRSSILNVFENLKGKAEKSAIDAALQSTAKLQRAKIRSSHLYPFELATLREEERGSFSYFPITVGDNSQPSRRQQSSESQRAIFENLFDLSRVLRYLLKAGGEVNDLSGIFCPGCDFSAFERNFDNANFEEAILVDTVWQFVKLEHAHFDRALLERADFTGAHLRGATFGQNQLDHNRRKFVEVSPYVDDADLGPHENAALTNTINEDNAKFPCSDLQDASFKHFAIMARTDDPMPNDYGLSVYFLGANVQGADFETVREVVLRPGNEPMPSERSYASDKIRFSKLLISIYDSDVEDAPRVKPKLGYRDMEGVAALLDLAEHANGATFAGPETTLKIIEQRRAAKTLVPDCEALFKQHRATPSALLDAERFLRNTDTRH